MTWIADVVLAFTVIEALVLLRFGRRRGLLPRDVAGMLLPGVGLVLALRFALAGAGVSLIGAALVLALLAHLYDLRRRTRR